MFQLHNATGKLGKRLQTRPCEVASFVFPSIGIDVSVALVSFPDPQYGTRMGLAEGLGMRLQKHQLHHI